MMPRARWPLVLTLGAVPLGDVVGQPSLGDPISLLWVSGYPDIRAALKLSDDQVRELDALREAVGSEVVGPDGVVIRRGRAEQERRAEQLLTPEQRTRHRQIAAQRLPPSVTDHFARPELLRALGINADQERSLRDVRSAFADAVIQAHASGDPAADVVRAIDRATAVRDRDFRAALTPAQRARLDLLFGEPYAGRYEPLPGPARVDPFLSRSFGRYDRELSVVVSNGDVREELKLPPERVSVFRQAVRLTPRVRSEQPEEDAQAKSEYVARTLAGLLTPAQSRRLRQIMLQSREDRSEGEEPWLVVPSAVSYPGVAEAVGLTGAQKDRLLRREDPIDVLTPQQQVMIQKMLGPPYLGRPVWAGEDEKLPPGPRGRVVMEFAGEVVGLTAAEVTHVARAVRVYQTAPKFDFPRVRLQLPEPSAQLEQAIADGVSPDRLRRIDQLARQQSFGRRPRAVLTSAGLDLSTYQVLRLYAVECEWRAVRRLGIPVGVPSERRATLPDRHRARLDESLLAVLTPQQRRTWDDMVGDPCPAVRRVTPVFSPVRYQ